MPMPYRQQQQVILSLSSHCLVSYICSKRKCLGRKEERVSYKGEGSREEEGRGRRVWCVGGWYSSRRVGGLHIGRRGGSMAQQEAQQAGRKDRQV